MAAMRCTQLSRTISTEPLPAAMTTWPSATATLQVSMGVPGGQSTRRWVAQDRGWKAEWGLTSRQGAFARKRHGWLC